MARITGFKAYGDNGNDLPHKPGPVVKLVFG